MERSAILDGVREVFAEQLKIHDLTEGTHLLRDLNLDSIQQLTLVVELENRFRVAFGDGEEAGIERVEDVVDLLERRLSGP
jgi:acyl carrier protein